MNKFKLLSNFNTKNKIALIAFLILALLLILGKNYIIEKAKAPSIKIHLINIAKVAIPLKNLILMRNVDDKIVLLNSSGSCTFCNLSQGDFIGTDLKGVDLRYANLSGANLINSNLSSAALNRANLTKVKLVNAYLQDAKMIGTDLTMANLKNADLRGVDFSNADLSGANLNNADLSGANLSNANLSGANLSNANLSEADLFKASIKDANLLDANLSNASLNGVNLDGAILRNADLTRLNLNVEPWKQLSGVDLSNQDLTGTILIFANLPEANLDGVDLSNKDLTGTNLSGVDLSNKDLTGTILSGAILSGANLDGVDLRNKDLTGTNLSGVDLSNQDLTGVTLRHADLSGVNLDGVDLRNKDLTGTNLSRVDLSNQDLTGTILYLANLSEAKLDGVDLRNKDLTGTNLSRVDLSNRDLSGAFLRYTNLSEANLDGVDLRNKDLTGTNLSGVDLSNKDLTGTILQDAKKIEISLKNPSNSSLPTLIADQNLNVTRYDLTENMQYVATTEGFLFELKNNESRLVLDLKNDNRLEGAFLLGIFGVASQNKLVYVSYIIKDNNGLESLVVDEYSMNFSKVRNIIKIGGMIGHHGGTLSFDSLGRLYLAVGDGSLPGDFNNTHPQDLNSLKGKILRLDVSKSKLEPEIIAYGIREPWGVTIDSKDRMFIMQCGDKNVEAAYFLNDLYSGIPANLGWPVFEGSIRMKQDPLMFNDVLAPIFETKIRPGCLTAGIYLNDLELFLLGDYFGTIRLLKQQKDGDWYVFHEYKQEKNIWGFGLDEKTKKIFVAPNNLELEISVDQVKPNQ